jgi:hypothetical protein
MKASSPAFGVGSLLDPLQTWLVPANPIARFVDLTRIE